MREVIFRQDKIIELAKGKSVLHLGFIQHSHLYEQKIQEKDWLHEKLNQVASKLTGLDYLKEDVDIIREKYGYECYFADVTKLDDLKLDETFDVIVCGELIEHIENAGLMLDGLKRFMHANSTLIITTPNPWAFHRVRNIHNRFLEKDWLNPEHTCWYTYGTLRQLLERKGYKKEFYGFYYGQSLSEFDKNKTGLLGPFKKPLKKLLLALRKGKDHRFDGLFFIVKKA